MRYFKKYENDKLIAISTGYTPVKGTNYYTETNKTEKVSRVISTLPTWIGGVYHWLMIKQLILVY